MCLMINYRMLEEGEGRGEDRITDDFVRMQSQDDASAELGCKMNVAHCCD